MKVNISQILRDHFSTLRDGVSGEKSIADLLIFFVLPILLGFIAYTFQFEVSKDFDNLSITFFGIFVALLLNIQVAVFGIFQRKWEKSLDKSIAELQDERLLERRELLSEMNSNIDYLTLVSCFSIVLFLLLFATEWKGTFISAIAIVVYIHFMLTLLMVIKRAHALFSQEYLEGIV